jgi:hypothetical protein
VALAQAYCLLQESCDQLGTIGQATQMSCEDRARVSCEAALTLGNSLSGDSQLASCTSSFKLFACENLAPGPVESCGLPGTLADDQPCEASFQCSGGLCQADEGQCGTCSTIPSKGETCDPTNDLCIESYCSSKKVCVAWAQKGEPCVSTYQCDSLLACSGGMCVDSLTVNQACSTAEDLCDYGLHCEVTPGMSPKGTCQKATILASGASCGASKPHSLCMDGEVCRGGSCQKPLPDGSVCAADGDCLAPARCITGKCALYGACAKK